VKTDCTLVSYPAIGSYSSPTALDSPGGPRSATIRHRPVLDSREFIARVDADLALQGVRGTDVADSRLSRAQASFAAEMAVFAASRSHYSPIHSAV
jgi:hypothetical protein